MDDIDNKSDQTDLPVRWEELSRDAQGIAKIKLGDVWLSRGFWGDLNYAVSEVFRLFGATSTPKMFSYGYPNSGPNDKSPYPFSGIPKANARADVLALFEDWGSVGDVERSVWLPDKRRDFFVWDACREARLAFSTGELSIDKLLRAALGYLRRTWELHTSDEALEAQIRQYCAARSLLFSKNGTVVPVSASLWITQWREYGSLAGSLDVRMATTAPGEAIAAEHKLPEGRYIETNSVVIEDGALITGRSGKFRIDITEVE